ncbi:hypothetical protein [Tenacibaculum aquimarinum]|uniref:hypothetical protein n=1 Tax=Tenacibaculum aquimarinum TaxID=2910675 RepID=UPI001F0A6FE7|nr:hypothetical protein [Tenacibaculum aquimarinum]MCH3884765.1 hypothetical protein [Tenacibaculum aquimarinum]
MKKIVFALVLFQSVFLFSQGRGGRGGGGRSQQGGNEQQERPKPEKFVAKDAAGIFYYEEYKVIKKIKVKDDDLEYKVVKSLKIYNNKIKEILFLNSEKLDGLDLIINSKPQQRTSVDDNESKNDIRSRVREIIKPIRDEVNENELILNESLKGLLSEKQLKKWLKYQKKKKESLQPKEQGNTSRQRGNGQGRGQRQR